MQNVTAQMRSKFEADNSRSFDTNYQEKNAMLKKNLSVVLSLIMFHAGMQFGVAAPVSVEDGLRAAKIKQEITRRGTGEKAGVKIKLLDNTELKGFIAETGSDSFVLKQDHTGTTRTLAYQEVAEVKGKGMSKAAKIGIGVGVAVAGAVAAIAVGVSNSDFGLGY